MAGLSHDIKILMLAKVLRSLIDLFCGSFLVAYIIEISHNDVVPVSMYNLAFDIAVASAFVFFGRRIKGRDKLPLMRAGIVANLVFLTAVIVLGAGAIRCIPLLGAFYGVATTAYSLPMNVLVSENVSPKSVVKYSGYQYAINGAVSVVAPLALGAAIHAGSYGGTAVFLLVTTLLELALSFVIPSGPTGRGRLDLHGFWRKVEKDRNLDRVLLTEYLKGLSINGALGTVITLYVIYAFETSLNLGIFTSVFAVFSIAMHAVFGRYAKRSDFTAILRPAIIFTAVVSFTFAVHANRISFVFYNLCYVTAVQLLQSITEINLFNVSNRPDVCGRFRMEYFVMREIYLNAGRVTGFMALLAVALSGRLESLKYLLAALTSVLILVGAIADRVNRDMDGETKAAS
ncbi:MAG: MFS transporter [Rickettsiales bacterium]|jgi:YQGE family putative transporter|nr:MFS transporter [Rickettsiales bacterium]